MDCTKYPCSRGCTRGHKAYTYNPTAFANLKRRETPMVCKPCFDSEAAREKTLLKTLRDDRSWKFTCKKIPAGMRAYAALNENWNHKDRCRLKPDSPGEIRWDGANLGITKDDLQWLIDRKSQ